MNGPSWMDPPDAHNRRLIDNVRPADWTGPAPSGRYNMVVIGAGSGGVVIVGSDCLGLTREDIAETAATLADNDLVPAPRRDGGYWLIGLSGPLDVFDGIEWGGRGALAATMDRAEGLGCA